MPPSLKIKNKRFIVSGVGVINVKALLGSSTDTRLRTLLLDEVNIAPYTRRERLRCHGEQYEGREGEQCDDKRV
jgi:hypothetical protein